MRIPRWTDNPNFNAQAAHFSVGSTIGMIACAGHRAHNHAPKQYLFMVIGFTLYASLKEFWYDANYEIPPQPFGSNFEDWLFYMMGFMTGVFIGAMFNQ